MNAAGQGRVTPGDLAARQMAAMARVGAAAERIAGHPDPAAVEGLAAELRRARRQLAAADRAQTVKAREFIAGLVDEVVELTGGFPPPGTRRPVMRVIPGGLAGGTS